MAKKYLFYILLGGVLVFAGLASAETNCDNQAKPALSCPEGYSMMCIPAGGDHWGCGKLSGGAIIEVSGGVPAPAETTGVKSTMQTQVRTLQLAPSLESETKSSETKKTAVQAKVIVRGWDAEKKQEIESNVQIALENNKEITSAEITEDTVTIHYLAPAKLFGFWSIKMNLYIFSDKEGRVKVKFPWYRFLVRTDFSNIAEEINGVFQNSEIDLEFLKSEDTAERQVKLFNLLSNILKAKRNIIEAQ